MSAAPAAAEPAGPAADWRTPAADEPVRANVTVPGSKSMTNRALVLAALADAPATVVYPLRARDTLLMRQAVASLGATITEGEDHGRASWHVRPGQPEADTTVNVGNAGTVMRFMPPVAALTGVSVAFHGDGRASRRPIGPVLAALRELGAVIDDAGRGAIPFTVHGTGSMPGGAVTLDASASSQFVSGLLLAAPRFDKGVEVRHRGARVPSTPHIDMTVRMLRDAGAQVDSWAQAPRSGAAPDTWRVQPGPLDPGKVIVQPDLSNAVPFLAAAVATSGTVTVRDWPAVTSQPAEQIIGLFRSLGAAAELTGEGLTLTGPASIQPVTADLGDFSESAPVIAALAACASGTSQLTGIGHMRSHETDRLAALAAEINALGGDVTELPDGLEVRPRPLRAAGRPFESYDDHRLVMAAAVLGLVVPGVTVSNAATVGKTFPEFMTLWGSMLGRSP
jgi:3-phosphoshikimate 1-carboxyvinyltransferase